MIGTTLVTVPPAAQQSQTAGSVAWWMHHEYLLLVFLIAAFLLGLLALLFRGKLSLKLPGGTAVDISGSEPDKKKDEKSGESKADDKKDQSQLQASTPNSLKTSIMSAHALCPRVVDFKHVVSKTVHVVSKISEIRYRGCLSEQMSYVEEQFINIRTMFQRIYLEKMREKINQLSTKASKTEEQYLYEDYRYYQTVVKLMLHDMESVIRASFINNHLTKYSPSEYQNYIELKFNVIKGLEADFIDTMYVGDWILSRNDIFEFHRQIRADFRAIIQDIYLKAQKVAENKEREVADLEKELQNYLSVTVSDEIILEKTN